MKVKLKKRINRWLPQGKIGEVSDNDVAAYGIDDKTVIPRQFPVMFAGLKDSCHVPNTMLEVCK